MTATARAETRPLERRRHQRVKVVLLGRYMLDDRREFPCQTLDVSPGGLSVQAPVQGKIGERVVAYLDHLGRVEGRIARLLETGFALAVNVPALKRERIADKLTWLANRQDLGLPEDRRHERIVPRVLRTIVTLASGTEVIGKIIDVSISGAAIAIDSKPSVGSPITLGQTVGRVVRVFETGVAVEFSRLLPAETFGPDIKL